MGKTGASGSKRGRGRGRGRPRGRGKGGRGPGRPRKTMVIESDEEEQIETSETVDNMVEIPEEPASAYIPLTESEEAELAKFEANRTARLMPIGEDFPFDIDGIHRYHILFPSLRLLRKRVPQELEWNQPYTPIGEKLPNPPIHMCDTCRLPIRIYGRMIPCKHVFCYSCSLDHRNKCPRCAEKVYRIEKNYIGTLFMCLHEGTRYGYDGCRRTYLSQRDLQAHINHRHKPRNSVPSTDNSSSTSQFHGGATRAKADSSQLPGIYGSSPEISTPSSSTGSRYERDRNKVYPQHSYQRAPSSTWPFRQY